MNVTAYHLPLLLRRVHAIGGMEAVLKLTEKLGGKRIFVPRHPVGANHPIAVAGDKVAKMLVEEFGHAHVDFPRGRANIRLMIARDVVARGGTNSEIAEEADVTRFRAKQLRRMVRKGKPSPVQGRPRARDPRQIDIEDILRK